jgi:hypothetical protein
MTLPLIELLGTMTLREAYPHVNSNFDDIVAALDTIETDVETVEDRTESFILACSDEETDLVVGTSKLTFRMPYAFTVTEVRASVTTAPTGGSIKVDIDEAGVTILSTVISIDAGEKTSTTSVAPAVISNGAIADDAEITIDIDQVGSTVAGAGLKVVLIGKRG